jgi:hypothetical protein
MGGWRTSTHSDANGGNCVEVADTRISSQLLADPQPGMPILPIAKWVTVNSRYGVWPPPVT